MNDLQIIYKQAEKYWESKKVFPWLESRIKHKLIQDKLNINLIDEAFTLSFK